MPAPGFSDPGYNVLRPLGEGSSGRVWLVEERDRPGTFYAVKELTSRSEEKARSLRREFATLSELVHPNLVQVYQLELDSGNGMPWIRMEYVEGEDLVTSVRREGADLCLSLAAEGLRCLALLHDFDRLHRDLKPANLLVRSRPRLGARLVALDFGMATRGADAPALADTAGTLPFIAPEILAGNKASRRSDLYSLGVVLFEAIHGRTPVRLKGNDAAGFIRAVLEGQRARPVVPKGYPSGLTGWLDELLAPDPAGRPADAAEALARLNATCETDFPTETSAGGSARLASGPPPGRGREIAELRMSLESADRPRVVLVTGDVGSGKRRLVRWTTTGLLADGWQVITPDREILGDPVAALTDWRRRAAAVPTLIVFDSDDGLSSAALGLMERVAGEARRPSLRVVAVVRPHEMRFPAIVHLSGQAGQVPTVRRVKLEALDLDGIRSVAERASGGAVAASRARWLLEASDGNADRAAELLIAGDWERGGRTRPQAERPLRLESLSEPAWVWLRALAALDGTAGEDLIRGLTGFDPAAAGAVAAETLACGLARRDGSIWHLASRRLIDPVLSTLDKAERQELSRRAARQLETSGSLPPALRRARILDRAGERERALELAIEAAVRCEGSGDAIGAVEHYTFALMRLRRRDPRRPGWRRRQADALRVANRPGAAARAYAAACRLATTEQDRARLMALQASAWVQAGRFSRGKTIAEQAIEIGRRLELVDVEAEAERAIGVQQARVGDGQRALSHLRRAVALFEQGEDPLALALAHQSLAVCETNLGLSSARARLETSIDAFRRAGAPERGMTGEVGLATFDHAAGRYDEAAARLETIRKGCTTSGNLLVDSIASYSLARLLITQGRHDRALAVVRGCEDQARFLADRRLLAGASAVAAEALLRCGRHGEAANLLDSMIKNRSDAVDAVHMEHCRLIRLEARLDGSRETAEALGPTMNSMLARFRELGSPDELLLGLCIETERAAEAMDSAGGGAAYAEFLAIAERGGLWDQPHLRCRAEIAQADAMLQTGSPESTDTALEFATRAFDRARELELPEIAARAAERAVRGLTRLERLDEASRVRSRGRALMEQAGRRIDDPELRRGFLEHETFARLRAEAEPTAGSERLSTLYEMSRALNSASDPERLLSTILDMALRVVRAERGLILLRAPEDEERYAVRVARNLEQETIEDAERFSRTVVSRAGSGTAVLAVDAENDHRIRDYRSVSLYGIRSVLCVPLRSRGTIIGAVYVDSRAEGSLFGPDDLKFIEAFADHAALALDNVRTRRNLERENTRLQQLAETRARFGNLIGDSPRMRRVFDLIEKTAESELPVLIFGESGTGKELVAKAIHFNGPRRRQAFVSENCAALPDSLLQSELFGHSRGAFTGADRERAGLFELADGGTLFLDEIGDTSPQMQAQLLRVLQEGEVRRVGGDRPFKVDVRVIAATHRDLARRVADGLFREDLLYRLQILAIELPPLRERKGDVALLTAHFLEQIGADRKGGAPAVTAEALEMLERHAWPGNVRELINLLQRLALTAGSEAISAALLAADPGFEAHAPVESTEAGSLERSERERIESALRVAGGNRAQAARLLGISRATIYRKIKEHRL